MIDVYMQYPIGVSDSQYYKSMIDNPPENIRYINPVKNPGIIYNKKYFLSLNYLKGKARYWASKLGLVIPNAHTSPDRNYDLIHCAHCLSKNDMPHVIDVESLWQLWISGKDSRGGKGKVLSYLGSDNCKKIIAWTEETRKDIIDTFPEVADKVEVVYYAMNAPVRKKKVGRDIILLFSGRHFYSKGGLHATQAMDQLTKKYSNVKCIINGVIPREVKQRYACNKKLKFYGLMPHEEMMKHYEEADIFVYPGYSDSFGFIFVEAMAYGLPIVTVDGYARSEIVGNFGMVIERPEALDTKDSKDPVVNNIIEATSVLIEDATLLSSVSKGCQINVRTGKFSMKRRKAKLSRIYKEAIGLNATLA